MVDTEGFDGEVVKMFLNTQPQPLALIFEEFHLSESDKNAALDLLSKNQYTFKTVGPNVLAIKTENATLL